MVCIATGLKYTIIVKIIPWQIVNLLIYELNNHKNTNKNFAS